MSSSKTPSRDWGLEKTTDGQPVAGRERPVETDRSQASTSTSTSTDTTGSAFSQPGYFKPFPTRSSGPRLRRTPGGLGGDRPPHDAHPEMRVERSRLAVALEREEEARRKREARQDDEVRRAVEARRRGEVVRPRTAQDWHLLAHRHAGVLHTGTYGLALSMGTATAGYDSLVVGVLPAEAPAGMRTAVLRLGQAMEETGRTLCSQIDAEVAASREGREQRES